MRALDLYSTHELLHELSKRHNGFVFMGYYSPRLRGDYPDQVFWDTDLPNLSEIADLGERMFNMAREEMEDPEEDDQ